jgi:hypothetical protein
MSHDAILSSRVPAPSSYNGFRSFSGTVVTNENGAEDTFTVELATQPTDVVDITTLSPSDEATVQTPMPLTFTISNWNMPQTVTVRGEDDAEVDGNVAYTIDLLATSNDAAYNGISTSVSAANLDNEAPPGPTVTYVASIEVSMLNAGGGQKRGRAVVAIRDDQGAPVPGATVQGDFTGDVTGDDIIGVTSADGTAILDSATSSTGNLRFTFTVDDVTGHPTLVYDPTLNVVSSASR